MKVAIVSQEYPPETAFGGIGSQNAMKAKGLACLGHEIHVIAHSTDDRIHETSDAGVHVVRIPGIDSQMPVRSEAVRWLTYSVNVATAIEALHERFGLDIIDFADWGSEGYVYLLNRVDRDYVPAVIHLHGPLVMFAHAIGWPDVESDFYRVGSTMEGVCLRLADAVFSSSRCSADWCGKHHGIDKAAVPVLHMGIDAQVFRPCATKASTPTVVFVGKIERSKGVNELLEAALRLVDDFPGLQLQLVGRANPALTSELEKRATEDGKSLVLDMPGFVPRDQLPAYLSRAHVFAAPSVYEGGPGFVYLEAMACGLPVVACEGSGAAEVVRHGVNGLLVPPRDVNALTEALHRLLANHEEREQFGRNAIHYVQRHADSKTCLQRLEKFYSDVVHEHRSGNGSA